MILTIRPEQPGDEAAIFEVIQQAFASSNHAQGDEQQIVERLRHDGALALSKVAELDGELIGHIAVCPVAISNNAKGWYGIGPVSVLPKVQGHGGGSKLMESTLHQLKESGAKGCVLVGDPAYYTRFGFKHISTLTYAGIPQGFFMALSFSGHYPRGSVTYPAAFHSEPAVS